MTFQWIKTQFPGVRYREHPTRKHNGKQDRYFTIRYKLHGKLKEEGVGWTSQGWNAQKIAIMRGDLLKGHKTGDGPETLSDKRQLTKELNESDRLKKEQENKERLTFEDFFDEIYFPQAKNNKEKKSYIREETLCRLWIKPVIGKLTLAKVSPSDIETIKSNMAIADRSERTIRYALAVIRQVFNHAILLNCFEGQSPIKHIKFPQADNQRLRFLSRMEAEELLTELKKRSQQWYEIAYISLYTGARADEIFSLRWAEVDIEKGTLILWDTKNTKTRIAFMTDDVKALLKNKIRGKDSDYLFIDRFGNKIKEASDTFKRAVDAIGLNNNVIDKRMKVVFHSLRHTFASWLVEKGEDLYTVMKLMGHSDIKMTQRYAHLAKGKLQNAIKNLDDYKINTDPKVKTVIDFAV